MAFTMQDFTREYIKEELPQLPQEEQVDVLAAIPLETLLAGRSKEQLRKYLQELDSNPSATPAKRRRKK